jgi:hypothetical protein
VVAAKSVAVAVAENSRYSAQYSGRYTPSASTGSTSASQRPEERWAKSAGEGTASRCQEVEKTVSSQEHFQAGQCLGSWAQLGAGEPTSMSQSTPVSRPASSTSSVSPTAPIRASPQSRPALRGGAISPAYNGPHPGSSVSVAESEHPQPLTRNTSGVQAILNPEALNSSTAMATATASRAFESENTSSQLQSGRFETQPIIPRPLLPYGQGHAPQQHVADRPGSGAVSEGRGGPRLTQAYGVLGSPRLIRPPRSPRPASVGQVSTFRTLNPQFSQMPSLLAPVRGAPLGSGGEQQEQAAPTRALHFGGVGPSVPVLPTTMGSLRSPPRSSSRPSIGVLGSVQEGLAQVQQQQPGPYHSRPRTLTTQSEYTAGRTPTPREPPLTSMGDGSLSSFGSSQSPAPRLQGIPTTQGDLSMLDLPGGGVPVRINKTVASKQADEKRHRAAQASSRFRSRRKEREEKKEAEIDKLQAETIAMERIIDELENEREMIRADRERIRADRDRLRSIVIQNPATNDLAYAGPPSPVSLRSGGSLSEPNPAPAVLPRPALPLVTFGAGSPGVRGRGRQLMPPVSYGTGNPSAMGRERPPPTEERPSRRRRTDPSFTPPSFISGPSPSISMPAPLGYPTSLSQPGTPSAMNRYLPPLRVDEPVSSRPSTSDPLSARTSTPGQAISPYTREPYETGWAVQPRGPQPPHPPPPPPGQR